ncbi:MAG TPA: YggS family pyridoxal phosphate-dependent enzyme [Methylocella sp.]|nr:YggS family pyridoxal phosphate-dependent enzyme [Methylocella sp.]
MQRSKKPPETSLDRLALVRTRIALAARDAGRAAQDISLVCVTKTFAAEEIRPVIEAGERVFGENRVQEAVAKWPKLREAHPDIELHLIGPLQSNKAREAVSFFDVIQTIDREKIAKALAGEIQKTSRHPKLFVQVNTGAEPQKAGILSQDADAFITSCRKNYGLEISGLMCIPPVDEQASPHFAFLNLIAARNGIKELSMGMSGDFELAIELGATHVRIGSAIFGAR